MRVETFFFYIHIKLLDFFVQIFVNLYECTRSLRDICDL